MTKIHKIILSAFPEISFFKRRKQNQRVSRSLFYLATISLHRKGKSHVRHLTELRISYFVHNEKMKVKAVTNLTFTMRGLLQRELSHSGTK